MAQPTGPAYTFLLTAIEGGALLWEQNSQAMQRALTYHDVTLRQIIKANNGRIFKTVGDSFYVVFEQARQALAAAAESQLALLNQTETGLGGKFKVQIALHSGVAEEQDGSYIGPVLTRLVALLDSAHGGQILLSQATKTLVDSQLETGWTLRELGEHRLKDLTGPEHIFQLVAPGLPADFPPLRTLNTYNQNLPTQAFALIGREQEIEQACKLLKQNEVRMLTFTGPGGTGKTRLSLQVAANLLAEFEDGVFFVDLSPLRQPKQIVNEVAKLFELRESNQLALIEDLKQYLRSRQMLLVLDNFEHLQAGATLVPELLAATSKLKIIVSSREALKVYGEREFAVRPLAIPDLLHLPLLGELSGYSALALFTQRAQLVKPEFQLNTSNAATIAKLCMRLDGLPLAIELAAARMDTLTPAQMLEQFNNRLALLVREDARLPLRQQSLQGAIEWGYTLLDQSSQTVFTRLAVFTGGCTAEAAEIICNSDYDPEIDTLSCLILLVNKNLLRKIEADKAGEPRFVMLDTIREYALLCLSRSGEEEQLRCQHAAFYSSLAEEAAPYLTGPQQVEWFQRLEQEHNNIRAVMNWALEDLESRAGIVLRLGAALWRFWAARGYLSESRHWLETALAADPESDGREQAATEKEIRAKAFNAAGILARDQGDYERATMLLTQSLALQRELKDTPGIASALNTLGTVQANLGNYATALTFHEETLGLRRELNDQRGVAISLSNLGALREALGDYPQSIALYQEALGLLHQLGDKRTIARVLHNLGHTMLVQGDLEQARRWIEESLNLRRELSDKPGTADSLILLAEVTEMQSRLEQALELYKESLRLLQEIGDTLNIAACLEGIAETLGNSQKLEPAVQLYGAAEQLREVIGAPLHPADRPKYEQSIARITVQLTLAKFQATWAAGRALTQEQAVTFALSS